MESKSGRGSVPTEEAYLVTSPLQSARSFHPKAP